MNNAQIINISMQNKPSMHNDGALKIVSAQKDRYFIHNDKDEGCC